MEVRSRERGLPSSILSPLSRKASTAAAVENGDSYAGQDHRVSAEELSRGGSIGVMFCVMSLSMSRTTLLNIKIGFTRCLRVVGSHRSLYACFYGL